MSSVAAVALLALAGLLVGGVISAWPEHKVAAVLVAVLAALALGGGVLRLIAVA